MPIDLTLEKDAMNIRKLSRWLCQLSLLPALAVAQEASGSAGAFLRMGVGARPGSLGDAYVAVASGPAALYWNPAGLAHSPGWQSLNGLLSFEISQRRFAPQRNFNFAGLAIPVGATSALGCGWIGFTTDGIEARRANTPAPDSYFSDSEHALLLSAAHRFTDWLAAGITCKGVSQKLFNESAAGYSASIGAQWFLHERLTVGTAIQDVQSSYRWNNGRQEHFPRTSMLGVAWRVTAQSLVSVDYHETAGEPGRWRAGLEVSNIASLPLRIGYSGNSFAAGAGLAIPLASHALRIDYHFASHDGVNGHAHAFSLAIEFGAGERTASVEINGAAVKAFSSGAKSESTAKETAKRPWGRESAQVPPGINADRIGKELRVRADVLNVRSGPGLEHGIIARLSQNERIRAIRSWGNWYEIRLQEEKSGWVHGKFVEEM